MFWQPSCSRSFWSVFSFRSLLFLSVLGFFFGWEKVGGGGEQRKRWCRVHHNLLLLLIARSKYKKKCRSLRWQKMSLLLDASAVTQEKSKFERVSLAKQVNDTTEVTQCHSRLKRRRQSRLPWLKTSEWRKFFFIIGEQSQSCDLRRAYCRKVPRWGFVLWSVVLVSSPFDTFSNE